MHQQQGTANTQKNIHTMTSIGTRTHARTHMRAKIHTNTNSVTHVDTHQISGATGSKATNSRNLIEAGRNQRMSWACQMRSLTTEIVTQTSEPMGHHYQIEAWLTCLLSHSVLLSPSLSLSLFVSPVFHYQWDTWLLTAAMHRGSHKTGQNKYSLDTL